MLRICENAGGFYKVQQLRQATKLFGIIILKERWVDIRYCDLGIYSSRATFVVETLKQANFVLSEYKAIVGRNNTQWKCM